MVALLNNSDVAYEEDLEVAEISNLYFDDEDGMCFIFASEPDEMYCFPNAEISKEETSKLCVNLFETGKIDLTRYGKYQNIDEI